MRRPTDDARTDVASVFVVELFLADALADTFANETASGEVTDVPDDADAVTPDVEDGTFVTNG